MIINGEGVTGDAWLTVVNPATGEDLGRVPAAGADDVAAAMASARCAQRDWAAVPDTDRCALLMQAADVLEANAGPLAELITAEQGKPLGGPGSMFEVEGAVAWTRVPASLELPTETVFEDDTRRDEMIRRPLGVIGAIAPWNWPVLIAIWQIVPSLRMGNTVVIKPSEFTPMATLEVVRLMNTVLPPGVVNAVSGDGEVGRRIVTSPEVAKIMFTGSVPTGREIMAASAPNLCRLTLELGGNDAAIVLPDVDPEAIAMDLFWGAFINMGQTCACAKRLYVHDDIYEDVVAALDAVAEGIPMGNGLEEGNLLGPVQNRPQFDKVVSLVDDARARGARIVRGGRPLDGPGLFYPVTLVADIDEDAPLVTEEQFGPVLPILRYQLLDDAVARANASPVGLGASVWSSDPGRAEDVARRLDAGTVWINQHGVIHPMVPFGGSKQSGFGLEFGIEGLKSVSRPQVISHRKEAVAGAA